MRSKRLRMIALVTALLIAVIPASGCSQGKNGKEDPKKTASTGEKPKLPPVELEILM